MIIIAEAHSVLLIDGIALGHVFSSVSMLTLLYFKFERETQPKL